MAGFGANVIPMSEWRANRRGEGENSSRQLEGAQGWSDGRWEGPGEKDQGPLSSTNTPELTEGGEPTEVSPTLPREL